MLYYERFFTFSSLSLKKLQSLLLLVSSSHPQFGDQLTLVLFVSQFSEATPSGIATVTSGNGCGINLLLSMLRVNVKSGQTRYIYTELMVHAYIELDL